MENAARRHCLRMRERDGHASGQSLERACATRFSDWLESLDGRRLILDSGVIRLGEQIAKAQAAGDTSEASSATRERMREHDRRTSSVMSFLSNTDTCS